MSQGDGGNGSFEEKLRALARAVGQSVGRLAGPLDADEVAARIESGGERVRELAEFAGRWLMDRTQDPSARPRAADADASAGRLHLAGPHPLDLPTEEQGLALSALDSGRWKVEAGTNELVSDGDGPDPSQRVGLVGELRARDWITADGVVTMLGRAAVKRWEEGVTPG